MADRLRESSNKARLKWFGILTDVDFIEKGPELVNNEAIQAINAAGTALVDLIKLDASNRPVIGGDAAGGTPQVGTRTSTQTSGDFIGGQSTPNQGATTTGEVFGWQFKPRVAANFDAATVNGLGVDSEVKSGTGSLSSDLRGFNLYMGATGSGTIGGNVVGLRARAEVNINPTGHIVLIVPEQHEGSQGWDGFIKFPAALGTHSMTTNANKTGNSVVGSIKVRLSDGTLVHLPLYADS